MSNQVKRWKVIHWPNRPQVHRQISPVCPKCGRDAVLEIGDTPGGTIIATIGLGIVFDPPGYVPPENFMPQEIQCRGCRSIWSD
jgi:hypothetical protein